jgi:galactose mutarotase-like enzyme
LLLSEAMPDAECFSGSEQGFATIGLRTPQAELVMVPQLGGRVIHLRSRRTGRDWCWRRPEPNWLWANRSGEDFERSPQAGIDECVPSVAACQWNGYAIPDHGEVWFRAWEFDPAERADGRLSATLRLDVSPFVFSRTIRAEEDRFIFEYALTNLEKSRHEFLWSLHPLFAIAPGDRLELPAEIRGFRLNGGLGDRPITHGDVWNFPEPFPGVRLDRLETPGMPQGCVKGFTGPLREGWASLVNDGSGDRLSLRWDPAENPWLGLWLNRGHGGFHHVALEPTNGAPDSLADAVTQWQSFGSIAAGETVRWTVEFHVN